LRLFFVDPADVSNDTLILEKRDSRHIRDVLRMKPGDTLLVSDGEAYLYQVSIIRIDRAGVLCAVKDRQRLRLLLPPRVTLLQAIPKGSRMDWLVQKATEMGVHDIRPVYMQRSIRILSQVKAAHWQGRWQRIATDAAKQCGRADVPHVGEPTALSGVLEGISPHAVKIFFDEEEKTRSIRDLRRVAPNPDSVVLLVGPEGGASDGERESVAEQGFQSVSLGELTLRAETAGMLSVALVRYEWVKQAPGTAGGSG
jgi:16S rRNA (uracil1498-N3)-methyltransferase